MGLYLLSYDWRTQPALLIFVAARTSAVPCPRLTFGSRNEDPKNFLEAGSIMILTPFRSTAGKDAFTWGLPYNVYPPGDF